MNYKDKLHLYAPYGTLEGRNDNGDKIFIIINWEHIYDNQEEARAEVDRLNAEYRKEQK